MATLSTSRAYRFRPPRVGRPEVAQVEVLVEDFLQVLGVDELHGADDPEGQLVVDGHVGPEELGIGEILVDQVDLAGERRRRPMGWFRASGTKAKAGFRMSSRVKSMPELENWLEIQT